MILILFVFTQTLLVVQNTPTVSFYQPPRITQELSKYFEQLPLKNIEGSKFCMYYADNTSQISMYVVNAIIKVITCPGVTMTGDLELEGNLKYKTTAMIVFLGNETKLNHVLEVILNLKQYTVRIPTMFIFCKVMEDDSFLEKVMIDLWKRGFISYIMILLKRDPNSNLNLEIYTYNPFQNLIYSFGRVTDLNYLFPNFLLDLQGYELRVSLFEDWPALKRTTTKGWKGVDYDLLRVTMRILNATYKIIEPAHPNFMGAHDDLVQNRSDICFVKYFQMENFDDVEFSYPLESDSAYIFAPTPLLLEPYRYVFLVFDAYLWLALGSCFIIVLVLLKLVVKYHHTIPNWSFIEVFLEVWCIMLSMTVKNLYSSKTPIKCVVIPWMLLCLVLSVGFQCNLRNQLQFPKYHKGIETLQDILDENVTVYSSLDIRNIPLGMAGLKNNVVLKSNQELKRMCTAADYSGVYLFPYRAKKSLRRRGTKRTSKFNMLPEPLLSGHGVYIFKKNSPYVDRFNKILLKQRENGLYMRLAGSIGKGSAMDLDDKRERISVSHLQGVFLIHFSGVLIGLVVFLLEIGRVKFMNFLE